MSSSGGNVIERLDSTIANFFQSWNWTTTLMCSIMVIALLYPIFMSQEPDIHPYFLARQSQASPVRQEGESAVYRANEIPMGYPLRKGLGVKDPGAPKWSAGRDGDLRDVWLAALRGPVDDDGTPAGPNGKLLTVLGSEKVVEQDFHQLTRILNSIGKYIQEKKGRTVAVCLSNSVELLVTIFASAFYDFEPVLVPYGISQEKLNELLKQSSADFFIGEAGTVDITSVVPAAPKVKHVIWVAKEGSKHLDWNDIPQSLTGKIDVATWHELVEARKSTVTAETPAVEKGSRHGSVTAFWEGKDGQYRLFEYSPANLVAGTGGLISSLSRAPKLSSSDILLPTTPLTESYALCWTFAALYSGASIALNSVAGNNISLEAAITGVSPTIIIASTNSLSSTLTKITSASSNPSPKYTAYMNRRSLSKGIFPPSTRKPALLLNPHASNIRLLFLSQRDNSINNNDTKISSKTLSDLRTYLGTRVSLALTTGAVAGAATQSNIMDYRDKGDKIVNVGAPVTSVEVYVQGDEEGELEGVKPKGLIVVRGPAVVNGKAELDVLAQIESDHTVSLL